MKKTIKIILSGVCVLTLSSCMSHYMGYKKGNIQATGIKQNGEYIFHGVSLNVEKTNPLKPSNNQFAIKLDDGSILLSKNFNYSTISSLPKVRKVKYDSNKDISFFIPGYVFTFVENELTSFSTIMWLAGEKYNPRIGKVNGKKFYKFPITKDDLEFIFGKPDKYTFWSGT